MNVIVPFGNTLREENVPALSGASYLEPAEIVPPIADLAQALRTSLRSPLGARRLREMARGRDKIAVLISDATRPSPSRLMLDHILEELQAASVPFQNVTVVVATGTHRASTPDELVAMVGRENLDRLRVISHDCRDESLVYIGDTPRGIPVWINRTVAEADLCVATGCITPHHIVGFSGGRKAILPGVAGEMTVSRHHSFPIYPLEPVHGWMRGNPAHEEALYAARLAGVGFIVNAVPDPWSKGYLGFVCGELDSAHLAGVQLCERASRAHVSRPADLTIVSPGGYPRDINLHQAQKALSVAERVTRSGGVIILVAECRRGAGSEFTDWLEQAATPEEMIEMFKVSGWARASGKAMMIARAAMRHTVFVVSETFDSGSLAQWFLKKADSVADAVDQAIQILGRPFSTLIVPRASGLIPVADQGFLGDPTGSLQRADRTATQRLPGEIQ